MAKGKPNLAFLEALKQDKRRRGDSSSGGAFKTPEWFSKQAAEAPAPAPAPAEVQAPVPTAIAEKAEAAPRKGFRLRYAQIAIGGAVVLVVAGMAYMAGRRQQPPKLSAATEQVRSAPAQGSVMDVPVGRSDVTPPAPIPVPVQPTATPAANAAAQPKAAAAGTAASPAVASAARTVGMNYVVFQSYKDEETAKGAKDALAAAGIEATVEKGHPYAPTWYVVIGTQGFARTTTSEYLQYIHKAQQASVKFAAKSKWKQFEPNPYKWR